MNPKIIADVPIAMITIVLVASLAGLISLNLLLFCLCWVMVGMSTVFLMFANVINGGYKNDWHRNEAAGARWREGLIAAGLFLAGFTALITQMLWEQSGSTEIRLLIGIIIIGIIFSYLNTKFRYKVFERLTPNEKEDSIKISDLGKYIRWYTWLIFLFYIIELIAHILPTNK